jgi:hypothetical protein
LCRKYRKKFEITLASWALLLSSRSKLQLHNKNVH